METLTGRLKGQDGTALIIAVIAMLVLGVIGFSFAILANLEIKIGVNQKHAVQALALAEAGLEHGRDFIRSAGTGFNTWVGNVNNGSMLITNQAFGGGTYSVRIDNDCSTNNIVPGPPTTLADLGCATNSDNNEQAALTAWATTSNGLGRARVRALVMIGNPWKHSCYNGDGILCTDEPGANPNATITPGDPSDPNGPATGPLPVPNNLVCGASVRRTGSVTFGATDCVMNPYYDKALDTPCPTCSTPRLGCAGHTGLPGDLCPDSGLVFYGCSGGGCTGSNLLHNADIRIGSTGGSVFQCAGDHLGGNHPGCLGVANVGVVVYVMGKVELANNAEVNGTLVVHGNGVAGTTGNNVDMNITGASGIWTINTACGAGTCGYPLALLVYDPSQATLPQNTYVNISNSNSEIHGLVYSAGEVAFNPITVDGGVVAWKSSLSNANSSIVYNSTYGTNSPPPGFSTPSGTSTTSLVRPSWIHCSTYSDDSGGPTPCSN